ncbi:MAG: hypothetical protein DRJ36_03315 [Thermoprotei archaeon]|nr:MAG: hypothetical protein DRJ36_03315 [Thermoprotei archaeon]
METRDIALTSIFTALVAATTLMVQVYIPETKGYFNFGELMVYLTALTLGPKIGAVAGGLGSALADIISGYHIYAPATLVIKGLEGLIVGKASRTLTAKTKHFKVVLALASILVFVSISTVGSLFYTGTLEWTLGSPIFEYFLSVKLESYIWIAIGVIAMIAVLYLGLRRSEIALNVFAMLCGGIEMVLGYFAYEAMIFGVAAAAVEMPFNLGQVTVGVIGATLLYEPLNRVLRGLRHEGVGR